MVNKLFAPGSSEIVHDNLVIVQNVSKKFLCYSVVEVLKRGKSYKILSEMHVGVRICELLYQTSRQNTQYNFGKCSRGGTDKHKMYPLLSIEDRSCTTD